MPQLDRDGDGEGFVLDLDAGENRFHSDWDASVSGLLDEVAATDGPRALVTAATGKFWSNGLDLDWLGAHPDDSAAYVDSVHALLAQVLSLPVPSVAA